MDKYMLLKKKWAVVIILLFFLVSISPIINAENYQIELKDDNKDTIKSDFTEVIFQVYLGNEIKNYKMEIQNQKITEYENLLLETKNELNKIETKEDSVLIINDFLLSLDILGIIPREINIEQLQEIMVYKDCNSFIMKYFENKLGFLENSDNAFCVIVGSASYVNYFYYLPAILQYYYCTENGWNWIPGWMLQIFGPQFLPIKTSSVMSFGKNTYKIYWDDLVESKDSQGWIWTVGTKGVKSWNEPFRGGFFRFDTEKMAGLGLYYNGYPVGVILFRGINIYIPSKVTFIGTARYIKIDN